MMKKGFTLIELLIVIAIIGILAVAFLPNVLRAPARARDTQRVEAIKDIMEALELYHLDFGRYPDSQNCGGATVPNTHWCNSIQSLNANGRWIHDRITSTEGALAGYLSIEGVDPSQQPDVVPFPPRNGGGYFYFSRYNNQGYMLVFGLENYSNDEPHTIELKDTTGIMICNPSRQIYFYGRSSIAPDGSVGGRRNGVITWGVDCPN